MEREEERATGGGKLSCGDHMLYPLTSRRWGNFIFMILQDSYGEESVLPFCLNTEDFSILSPLNPDKIYVL